MIKWYFILLWTRVAGENEEIYVNEDLGTMLISKGLLLADQRSEVTAGSETRIDNGRHSRVGDEN